MRKKKVLLGFIAVLVLVQFIRPTKNVSTQPPGKNDFVVSHAPPAELKHLLEVACYDCHSNNTRYPWYAEIQPVGWWLTGHVRDAKKDLNFSEFGSYSEKDQRLGLDAIIDQLTDRTMPLKSYQLIHGDARLTDAQRKALADWVQGERDKLD